VSWSGRIQDIIEVAADNRRNRDTDAATFAQETFGGFTRGMPTNSVRIVVGADQDVRCLWRQNKSSDAAL
jgi:hypothetical protein